MININPLLQCDYYKIGHPFQYPKGTSLVYSNMTARNSRLSNTNEIVFFGLQAFIKDYLIDQFNKNFFNRPKNEVVDEYKTYVESGLGPNAITYEHIEKLHDLQYLPIEIKALPEGSVVPVKVPFLTIKNTLSEFYWLTNFIETILSTSLWQPITSATIAKSYREILNKYAIKSSDNIDFVDWQAHDFSMRGLSSLQSAMSSGAGHLLFFNGTDTIPSMCWLSKYYGVDAKKELIGGSVPATEHSVMCAGGKEDEFQTFKRLITEVYPTGIVSIVSDTWDLWKVITETLPKLKSEIETRNGKVVIRPDSGNPVNILCGQDIMDLSKNQYYLINNIDHAKKEMASIIVEERVIVETPHGERGESNPSDIFKFDDKYYKIKLKIDWGRYDKQYYFVENYEIIEFEEIQLTNQQKGVIELLYEIFGGTINNKGYKELPSYIGAIYGDSITTERCEEICKRLLNKGFSSTNVVFGVGSYTYQYNTRDTFGMAMKATYVELKDLNSDKVTGYEIYKDPITDNGNKKSAKGLLSVLKDEKNNLYLKDSCTKEEEEKGELKTVFKDSTLIKDQTLNDIRKIVRS